MWTRKRYFRSITLVMVVLVSLFSLVPRVEASFISSSEGFTTDLRQHDLATVQKVLEQKLVKQRLEALGYSQTEIQERLGQLSNEELHSLATQIDTLAPGGDALGVIIALLVIVLLVVLILKLLDKTIIIS
ncbi:MAG: PA2779 family protein [Deltaproteobacteria bacterium]|nr:PA2779 family protein [Deltaproteobacteria bacterium]MBW2070720.1 PA2779 family protein [Deltaproteobacteria bacterium]